MASRYTDYAIPAHFCIHSPYIFITKPIGNSGWWNAELWKSGFLGSGLFANLEILINPPPPHTHTHTYTHKTRLAESGVSSNFTANWARCNKTVPLLIMFVFSVPLTIPQWIYFLSCGIWVNMHYILKSSWSLKSNGRAFRVFSMEIKCISFL